MQTRSQSNPLRQVPAFQETWAIFDHYFEDGYFERRGNQICLTLYPQRWFWSRKDKALAWAAVHDLFHRDERWDHTEVMKQQFYCHARFVYQLVEREWNLEPVRTTMNFWNCN